MKTILALPEVIIQVDGITFPAATMRALSEVRVQQRFSLPAQCEVAFRDPPGPLDALDRLSLGATLRVVVNGHADALFTGQVTAIEQGYGPSHGREVRVRSYDALHRLRSRQTLRTFIQVTPEDLAREMVADLGLAVEAAQPGALLQTLIQFRQSDLDLLVEVSEQSGLYLTLRDSILDLLTLEGNGEMLPLALGDSLLEARVELNSDTMCPSVSTEGWNPSQAETHQGRAVGARSGREIGWPLPLDAMGSEHVLVNQVVHDDNHADALAQSELDARVAREAILSGVAEGDPRLRPGARVTVSGVLNELAGQYVLTSVTHTVDARSGFVSEFSTQPPARRRRVATAATALGTVTRVDDPQRLGRIKVALPAYGNVETDWLGVLFPGAGPNKGLMCLPDVQDLVLVIFGSEDPSQGIVLGGLYGARGAPDSGVEDAATRRYTLLTAGGLRIRLDDKQQIVRLEDSTGSYFELTPGGVRVHAAVDMVLEAPGRSVVIRGQSIDFQRA